MRASEEMHAVRFREWLEQRPWIWALAGSILLWLLTGLVAHRLNAQSLTTNAALASFLAVVAVGQMYVITAGNGGIDLSIPYVMTLTAFLSINLMNGSNARLPLAVAVSLACGLAVGVLNALIVLLLRVPPIVATLAMGFIVESAALVYAHGFSSGAPAPILVFLTQRQIAGVPVIILCALVLAVVMGIVLTRTIYGRELLATGQNRRAADLAGVATGKVIAVSYVLSGLLAALAGVLLGGYVGGAFLDMGDPYLLQSIGAVVIGGTLISGGKATVTGTLMGALFLVLANTFMEATKMSAGFQDIVEGALIILVLIAANWSTERS